MTVTKIGARADGTLLGEDENGQLYTGKITRVGWDKLERVVSDNGDDRWLVEYKVGDFVVSKGTMRKIPDEEMAAYMDAVEVAKNTGVPPPSAPSGFNPNYHQYQAEKKTINVPMPDGTNQEFERLFDVPEWTLVGG